MHGCFGSYLVYGFPEVDRDKILSDEELEKYGLRVFALDVVNNYVGEAVYGISCSVDKKTGQPSISEDEKSLVEKIYNKAKLNPSSEYGSIGYYLAMSGDFEVCHKEYFIDEDEDNEDENGDENE